MTNRPTSLATYIGQEHIVANLKVILGGAKERNEAAPHCLFIGPPGLGKTSIANVIAAEVGTTMVPLLGTMVKKEGDIAGILAGLCERDVLFVDEIHAMPRRVAETLYTAVEDFYLDILIGPKGRAQPARITLPPFTLVGATTHPGGISGPLRDRFGYVGKLSFYGPEDLIKIIEAVAAKEHVPVTESGAAVLACASRGTPRVAINLYERARDIVQTSRYRPLVNVDIAKKALDLCETNPEGLTNTDRAVLRELQQTHNPMGLSTLAATLGEEESTIETMIEPFLLRNGLIHRMPTGRVITQRGLDVLHG